MSGFSWDSKLKTLDLSKFRVPTQGERIWKDECAFTFATPYAENGLFVNLETFQAFSVEYLELDQERTGNELYLQIKWRKVVKKEVEKPKVENEKGPPTKMAIGIEGGFDVGPHGGDVQKTYALVWYPNDPPNELQIEVPVSGEGGKIIPPRIAEIVNEIVSRDDASKVNEVAAWNAADEIRPISKFAESLEQVDNGVRISHNPSTWKCADSGMATNLWLNLHDGYIGSGRQNWDGTGGTGAAMKHFEETGKKYPLCVKLGTITPDGDAEVYSYDASEDAMVRDPYLAKHLAHFGLDIKKLKKTDKTLIEMEVDFNMKHVFSAVTEDGKQLKPCYGPGHVGLQNLGNSCYMNSLLQSLFALDEFQKRFLYGNTSALKSERMEVFLASPAEPQSDSEVQFLKLAAGLSDPEAGHIERDEENSLAAVPRMIKDTLGKDHPDYRGKEQQDSVEYLRHILAKIAAMDENSTHPNANPGQWFQFVNEERLQCRQSNMVKYKKSTSAVLSLTIPMHKATNMPKVEASKNKKSKTGEGTVLPTIPFHACLECSIGDDEAAVQTIVDYLSPATGQRGIATQTTYIASFPKYLCVQLRRYVVSEIDYTEMKLNCEVDVPLELELSKYKSPGLREHEVELPDTDTGDNANANSGPDANVVAQLQSMGFDENLCKHAALNNINADTAVAWIFENMENPAYLVPPTEAPQAPPAARANPDISEDDIVARNNGTGHYKMRAIISHIGNSTGGGHYVAHVFDTTLGQWILYNDRKVAISDKPPLEHGYAYIFERDS